MAGVKGRSGGARPGSGPKKQPKPPVVEIKSETDDTLALLHDIAFGRITVDATQLRAAIAAVQYTHTKRHDGGKKEDAQERAEKAAGKFGARPAPLKLVNG
jgi:phage terminase small subunit